MYLHIGGDVVVALGDLVVIMDALSMERSARNQEFLRVAEEEGFLEIVGDGVVNSWVITTRKVYGSPISSLTLKKRAGFTGLTEEAED